MTVTKPPAGTITAQEINKRQRLQLLPAHLGRLRVVIENMIYAQLAQLSPDYKGGCYWRCYQLSNGGFYMAPGEPEKLTLYHSDNYFEGKLSADAAGIVASLFVLNQLSARTGDSYFEQLERWLKEYAATHPEAELIFKAID